MCIRDRRSTVKYYKIRAYRVVDGVRRYSRFSEVQKNLPAVEVRFVEDRERNGDYQYVLNWQSISSANGYEVYTLSLIHICLHSQPLDSKPFYKVWVKNGT